VGKQALQYTAFTSRMLCTTHGNSRYGEKVAYTLFGALGVSSSQEAFNVSLQEWAPEVGMHDDQLAGVV
jgi:hypothetical protein